MIFPLVLKTGWKVKPVELLLCQSYKICLPCSVGFVLSKNMTMFDSVHFQTTS